jgi:hypothetical protein
MNTDESVPLSGFEPLTFRFSNGRCYQAELQENNGSRDGI